MRPSRAARITASSTSCTRSGHSARKSYAPQWARKPVTSRASRSWAARSPASIRSTTLAQSSRLAASLDSTATGSGATWLTETCTLRIDIVSSLRPVLPGVAAPPAFDRALEQRLCQACEGACKSRIRLDLFVRPPVAARSDRCSHDDVDRSIWIQIVEIKLDKSVASVRTAVCDMYSIDTK